MKALIKILLVIHLLFTAPGAKSQTQLMGLACDLSELLAE
jgi:hypothetical protein